MAKEEANITQINLRVKDNTQFYANETTINFGPLEFVLDFRCGTHIQDASNLRAVLMSHNVVVLTPYHAKTFSEILSKAVKDYEDKFGNVKKPSELKKAEDMIKKEQKKVESKEKKQKKEDGMYYG